MTQKTELQEITKDMWSDYCDLDYWIADMTRGSDSKNIPKHVMKMAMKHLRDDIHKTYQFLCRLEASSEMEENNNDT
jgi:hypothetical protein